jgi:hypothetical protein
MRDAGPEPFTRMSHYTDIFQIFQTPRVDFLHKKSWLFRQNSDFSDRIRTFPTIVRLFFTQM